MTVMISAAVTVTPIYSTSASSWPVPMPPAFAEGDLLVMGVTAGGNTAGGSQSPGPVAPDTPSGWTRVSPSGNGLGIFTRTAGSDEPSSYTVTLADPAVISAFTAAYPAGSVSSSSFAHSSTGVLSFTTDWPSASGSQLIVAAAGAVASTTSTWGNQTFNWPGGLDTAIQTFGVNIGAASAGTLPDTCCLGLCEVTGSAAGELPAPVFETPQDCTFLTGFLVLDVTGANDSQSVTAAVSYPEGHPGLAVTVAALTGAATPQEIVAGGATEAFYASGTSTAPQAAITPNQTGSYVYGAVTQNYGVTGGTSYTAGADTTFSQNVPDSLWNAVYGTFRSTGTVTGGTAVTLGGTAPANAYTTAALAEIIPASGSTLAETATAAASGVGPEAFATTSVAQSAIFRSAPDPGTLLVATVSANSLWSHGSASVTVSDSSGLTWIPLVQVAYPSYSGVWAALVPSPSPAVSGVFPWVPGYAYPGAATPGSPGEISAPPSPGGLVQSASGWTSGTALTLAFPKAVTAGNGLVVACCGYPGGSVSSITPVPLGGAFSRVASSGSVNAEIWAGAYPASSTALTIAATTAGIIGYGYEVTPFAIPDTSSGNHGTGKSLSSGTTPATIPYPHFCAGLAYVQGNSGTIAQTATGWTAGTAYTGVSAGSQDIGAVAGYQFPASSGTYTYAGTAADSSAWGAVTANFALVTAGPAFSPAATGWGGYSFAEHASYTGVTASFTVPGTIPANTGALVSVWIGMGDVYQTGIYLGYDTLSPGSIGAHAWTWWLPGAGELWDRTAYPVRLGDSLSLGMRLDGSYWYMTFEDITQGWSYTEAKSVLALNTGSWNGTVPSWVYPVNSAEVIIEKEGSFETVDYGSIAFTGITTTPGITQAPSPIITVNDAIDQYPGPYSIAGSSFTMYWNNYQ